MPQDQPGLLASPPYPPDPTIQRRSVLVGVLAAFGLLLIIAGQWRLTDPALSIVGLGAWLAGLGIVVRLAARETRPDPDRPDSRSGQPTDGVARRPVLRAILLLGVAVGTWWVWTTTRARPIESQHLDIVFVWFGSMLVLVVAVSPLRWRRSRLLASIRAHGREIATVLIVTIMGLLLRTIVLDRFPRVFTGDEGAFGFSGREVLTGTLRDPFATGWDAHPTLWFFAEAGMMHLVGDGVVGARLLSALIGSALVPLVYVFIRQQIDRETALSAAVLSAVFPFALFLSRNALNNVAAPFFAVLTLLLLTRLGAGWRPTTAVLTGIAIGMAQYSYVSNRILIPVAGLWLLMNVVFHHGQGASDFRQRLQQVVAHGALLSVGALVTLVPLAAFYIDQPANFSARTVRVTIFGTGWLDAEQVRTGHGVVVILLGQIQRAALIPFHGSSGGFYITDAPTVGWPLAVPAAIGLAMVTVGFRQRRHLGLAIAYWAAVIGLAFTESPIQINRFAIAAGLLPVFAAMGIVTVARIVRSLSQRLDRPVTAVMAGIVLAAAVWNVGSYFDDSDPSSRSRDPNTLIANTLAYQLQATGPQVTVYYAASPRMTYRGHPNLPFIARGNVGIDILEPWSDLNPPPELTGPAVFVFVPERRGELHVVQGWFPDGEMIDVFTPDRTLLYTTYWVGVDVRP